ncbi:GNAT family N-acetyltransferase [Aquabacterium humicola]|uniref:GNAT family N-acetyltransferase n=1 Tax=Aquabacterium humicola TaxID=3237377 RepID=UPI002542B1EC|nr:GNAT family N-acetyltransferase [Rubrivivax pictus]
MADSTPCSVHCAVEPALPVDEFQRVLVESGLGAIRPIDDRPRLQKMLDAADLVLVARRGGPDGEIVGVARAITDFSWCAYLSDLAVCGSAQGLGVGHALLDEARRQLGPQVSLVLLSVPEAVGFYERAGMAHVADAFWYRRTR